LSIDKETPVNDPELTRSSIEIATHHSWAALASTTIGLLLRLFKQLAQVRGQIDGHPVRKACLPGSRYALYFTVRATWSLSTQLARRAWHGSGASLSTSMTTGPSSTRPRTVFVGLIAQPTAPAPKPLDANAYDRRTRGRVEGEQRVEVGIEGHNQLLLSNSMLENVSIGRCRHPEFANVRRVQLKPARCTYGDLTLLAATPKRKNTNPTQLPFREQAVKAPALTAPSGYELHLASLLVGNHEPCSRRLGRWRVPSRSAR